MDCVHPACIKERDSSGMHGNCDMQHSHAHAHAYAKHIALQPNLPTPLFARAGLHCAQATVPARVTRSSAPKRHHLPHSPSTSG